MKLKAKLVEIQIRLDAKKTRFNHFGKYNYRSLEDIYAGLKPLFKELNCGVRIDNELVDVCGHIFRKSVATFFCLETDETITSTMYTQENLTKTGMSPEQCSGSTASYGDKYCLHKLFAIDDSNDPDALNKHGKDEDEKPKQVQNPPQKSYGDQNLVAQIYALFKKFAHVSTEQKTTLMSRSGIGDSAGFKTLAKKSNQELKAIITTLESIIKVEGANWGVE